MRNRTIILTVALVVAALALPAAAGGRPLSAVLSGENEVGAGDPDGSGLATMTLNQGQGEICWELDWENIEAPNRAHIHRGPAGMNGGVVVFFFDTVIPNPIPVADSGCVDVDPELIKEIRQNPSEFYVNVHNPSFPGGAIRGQLSK